jgi:hypothetical protein
MANKVTIFCAGGCGRSITLRSNKVRKADYYVCATRKDGAVCLSKIPKRPADMIRVMDMHAAGSFRGCTDKLPDEEEAAAVNRARDILASAKTMMTVAASKQPR